MSIGPENKAPLLGPIADDYEPSDADADRVFAKIQAALGQASAATAANTSGPASNSVTPSVPPAAGMGIGKKVLFVGLSCAALAILGTFAATRTDAEPVRASASAVAVPAPTQAKASTPTPPVEARIEEAPAIPSVSVDSLPTAAKRVQPAPSEMKPSAAPATATPPSDTLEREARLLADARQARQAGQGTRALGLLDEHARTFPNGWLANDRAVERIVVLCSLGRQDEAVREAAVFLNGRPKSPLTRRVEMSCAGTSSK